MEEYKGKVHTLPWYNLWTNYRNANYCVLMFTSARIKQTLKLNGFLLYGKWQMANGKLQSGNDQTVWNSSDPRKCRDRNLSLEMFSHGHTFQPYFYSVIHLEMAHERNKHKHIQTHKGINNLREKGFRQQYANKKCQQACRMRAAHKINRINGKTRMRKKNNTKRTAKMDKIEFHFSRNDSTSTLFILCTHEHPTSQQICVCVCLLFIYFFF